MSNQSLANMIGDIYTQTLTQIYTCMITFSSATADLKNIFSDMFYVTLCPVFVVKY